MRRAFSLVELLTVLVLLGLVLAAVVRAAVFHERFQRADASARAGGRAAHQAVAVVAAALRPATTGDLQPGGVTDSSVEFLALVGSGAGCLVGPTL
ncbi:MAG: prepilin-type N-terminal cleavage/methylation domain-containing protein, partial [Gemmatimonadota bacterium]|nr:prepilin-type N-terminal cleavage/methylation domain-containing protein [Gemmatimonadota bacterium]